MKTPKREIKCFNCFGNMVIEGKKLDRNTTYSRYIYKYICTSCSTVVWK